MAEHRAVAVIAGAPDEVFAYLSDVANLPAYLPVVASATRTGREDAVVVTAGGTPRALGMWVRAYRDRRHLSWGTEHGYRGELHVSPPRAGGAGSAAASDGPALSVVTVTVAADRDLGPAVRRALEAAGAALRAATSADTAPGT